MLKRLLEQNKVTLHTPTTVQYLSFKLGADEYGVDIRNVQELRGYNTVTPVASASRYIKGVINLRGTIVPIVDLRIRFNVSPATYNQTTAVIILAIGNRVFGVIVDGVSNLLNIASEQIEWSASTRKLYAYALGVIKGLGRSGNRGVNVIDADALSASMDFGFIEGLSTCPATTDAADNAPSITTRDRVLGFRHFWIAHMGGRAQVSALKFRPH